MFTREALLNALSSYAKWDTLPRELQLNASSAWCQQHGGTIPTAHLTDEQVQTAFLKALSSTVPFEWSLSQHDAFSEGSKQQATMYGQAAGTPYGIMCFGGMQVGKLTEMKVKSEVSWIKDFEGYGLQPDYSKVYKAAPSHFSNQVLTVTPCSTQHNSPWAAQPCSPPLPIGLIGHSVALCGSRVFIFGGMETPMQKQDAQKPAAAGRTSNKLRAYAVDEAGTQGGLLPVLSELPQRGEQPSSRMYHRAAVDPSAGIMYVYGGVHLRDRDGARLPADNDAGVLHCYNIHNYTWSILKTTGACRPCSTTLLAFFWHDNALWAIPDVPLNSSGRSGSSSRCRPAGYKLLRLDMDVSEWQEVATEGEAPCLRTDSCSIYHNGKLIIYGGKTAQSPVSMLSDLHVLDLEQQPPTWQQQTPRLSGGSSSAGSSSSSHPARQQTAALLALAGHTGGVDSQGRIIYYGGYRRYDVKEPQSALQVLQLGVKPPTPDAAELTGAAAAPLALAMQHVRLQLARLVRQHHPKQVLLKPDGGGGVRLPARLLALYSCLFDDMFQDMLQQEEEEGPEANASQPQVVPVPGASMDGVACVCRWIMGLLALGSCSMTQLVEMYRVADRLIMERLMVEVLELLAAADISSPQQAAIMLKLTGDLSGRADVAGLGAHATTQLRQQINPATAPGIMSLAQQHNNQQLQDRCIEVMYSHRKNNVYAVLDFALTFNLPKLQGSCLAHLSHTSRGRLVDSAERILKAASKHSMQQPLCKVPVVQMLEKDLLIEVGLAAAGQVSSLPSYAAAAQRHGLVKLGQGLTEVCAQDDVVQQLQMQQNEQVLQHMLQRFSEYLPQQFKRPASGRTTQQGRTAAAAGGAQTPPVHMQQQQQTDIRRFAARPRLG